MKVVKALCFVILMTASTPVLEAAILRIELPSWRVTYIGYPGYRAATDTQLVFSRGWPSDPFAWDADEDQISFTFTDSKHPQYTYTFDAHLPDAPGNRIWMLSLRQPLVYYPFGSTSLVLGGAFYLNTISSFLIGAAQSFDAWPLQLTASGGAVFRNLEIGAGTIKSEPSDYVHLAGHYIKDKTPVSVSSWSTLGYWVQADASLFLWDSFAVNMMGGYISEAVFSTFTFNAGSRPIQDKKKGPVSVNGSFFVGAGILLNW